MSNVAGAAAPTGPLSTSANTGQPAQTQALIAGMFAQLPPMGEHWSIHERMAWLRAMASIFDLLYHVEHPVQVGAAQPPSDTSTSPADTPPDASQSATPSSGSTSSAQASPPTMSS